MSTRKNGVKPVAAAKPASRNVKISKEREQEKKKASTTIKSITEEEKLKKKKVEKPQTQTSKIEAKKRTLVKKKTDPATPPSSRVSRIQYFPTKKLYSNAIKEAEKVRKNESTDESSASERPRTATLRKGSIVNTNIVGPDVPKSKAPKRIPPPAPVESPSDDYEEDFESYESDFEEYHSSDSTTEISTGSVTSSTSSDFTEPKSVPKRVNSASTDEERKLDSGNFELPDPKHKQILDNINESEKENVNRINLISSPSDEGFEDGKSLQFINFLSAKRKHQHRKSIERMRRRGEEILSMIKLDSFSFTLIDLPPVPYETFIKSFGKSNTIQTSTQTGEDNLEEETQTDEIFLVNKWTQCPPVITRTESANCEVYRSNYLGVGEDPISNQENPKVIRESALEKFLLNTSTLIFNIQAEEIFEVKRERDNGKTAIPFSKSCQLVKMKNQTHLKSRPIKFASFILNDKIIIVHGPDYDIDNGTEMNIVSIWSLLNLTEPEKLFSTFGAITACCYEVESFNLFGGLQDGTIVVWENNGKYNQPRRCEGSFSSLIPTFNTEVNHGHSSKIIGLHFLHSLKEETNLFEDHAARELCSLDEEGQLIIWSVVFKQEDYRLISVNQGLAHWGSVILVINNIISLNKLHPEVDDFRCTDFTISPLDTNHAYISTNYGLIIHCLTNGTRPPVKKFLPDARSQVNCLEMCPFSPQYFLAGFDNGDISLYSRLVERPVMVLSNRDSLEGKSKIEIIQWSMNRPLIFYTKDVTNSLHVWNLKVCDMFPTHSVPFTEKIIAIKLSSDVGDVGNDSFMLIATENGSVYVHLLDAEHGCQAGDELEIDKRRLFNYINRYI